MSGVRKALAIGRINLLRQLRDRGDLFFVLVLPTLIIVALGLQFGGTTAARLGVVVPADDADAAALVDAIRADDARFDVRPVSDEATLRSKVEHGELEAGLVIPDGFSAALRDPASGTVELRYLGTTAALAQVSGRRSRRRRGGWRRSRRRPGSRRPRAPGRSTPRGLRRRPGTRRRPA